MLTCIFTKEYLIEITSHLFTDIDLVHLLMFLVKTFFILFYFGEQLQFGQQVTADNAE